jgi:hypothetical protein
MQGLLPPWEVSCAAAQGVTQGVELIKAMKE